MKITFRALLVGLFLLVACGQVTIAPTVIEESPAPNLTPSQTPVPSQTHSPTRTQPPSPDPHQTPTPGVLSRWTETYPTKQVLVFYGAASNTQTTSMFITSGQNFDINPFLILYTDGQLILSGSYEKHLSQKELDDILTKFEQLGFYQIEGTAPIDERNPIYTFPDGEAPIVSGTFTVKYIAVDGQKSNGIGYMADWEEYLNQPVKDIITYLKSFSTEGASRYQPDRLLVGVATIQETSTENQTIIPWPEDITPPLGIEFEGVLYLEGVEATKLHNMVRDNPEALFLYEGKKLWLVPRPIYPHECHISSFSFYNWIPTERPYFFCEDP